VVAVNKMLANLRAELDEIEKCNEWEHRFVQDLIIREDEGRLGKLTDKQFMKLLDIHEKYCTESSARERQSQAGAFRRPIGDQQ